MKIFIKTLRGDKFEVEVELSESVLNLKEKIYAMQGHDTAMQKLILAGKILEDGKTLDESGVQDGSTLVIMVTKPKPAPRNVEAVPASQSSPAQPAQRASPAQEVPPPVPTEPQSFFSEHAGTLVTGDQLEQTISNIVEMGFPREQVMVAMRAAFNNPDRAIEYLMTGIPEEPQPAQQAPPMGGGGGGGSADLSGNPLAFLADNPNFQQLRSVIQQNPAMLGPLLNQLSQANPELAQTIMNNQEAFMQLLQDPGPQIDPALIAGLPRPSGAPGGPPAQPQGLVPGMPAQSPPPGTIQLTREEADAVQRLKELGFHQRDALEAYLSCDKNEMVAANLLFENYQSVGQEFEQIPEGMNLENPPQEAVPEGNPAPEQPPQEQPPQDPPQEEPQQGNQGEEPGEDQGGQ